MRANFIPTDSALPFLRAQPAFGDQPAQVRITAAILRQQNYRRTVVDRNLGTNNELEPNFARFHVRAHDAIDAVSIRQSQSRQSESMGLLDQLIRMARAFEERKITLAPEWHVAGHKGLRQK